MTENVEQIEAMLAAYIDGALTPEERVELERHLSANPAHRALIRELTGHRDLLRSLPREPAPEGLAEPLEGAMERDALLGGGDPLIEFKVGRKRRWWPQVLAAAAIFILAFGLGAIVFYVLPPKHPTVAIVQPPEQAEAEEADEAGAEAEAGAIPQVAAGVETRLTKETVAAMPPAEAGMLEAAGAVAMTDASSAAGRAPTDAAGEPMVRKPEVGLIDAVETGGGGETLVITITAEDVRQAGAELRNYFADNGIAWSDAGSASALAVLAEQPERQWADMRPTSRFSGTSETAALAETPTPAGGRPAEPAAADARPVDEMVASASRGVEESETTTATLYSRDLARDRRVAAAPTAAGAPSTMPVVTGEAAVAQLRSLREAAESARGAEGAAGAAGGAVGTAPGTDRYVVVASLNSAQATRLADAFAQPALGRRAALRRESAVLSRVVRAQRDQKEKADEVRLSLSSSATGTSGTSAGAAREGEELKLAGPSTRPAEPVAERVVEALTTQPARPLAVIAPPGDLDMDSPAFNCVVVLQTPGAPAMLPAARTMPAAPATRPAATSPATQPAQ